MMKKTTFYQVLDSDDKVITEGETLEGVISDAEEYYYDKLGHEGSGVQDVIIVHCDADMEPIHTQDYVISWDAEPVGDYEEHNVMWNAL